MVDACRLLGTTITQDLYALLRRTCTAPGHRGMQVGSQLTRLTLDTVSSIRSHLAGGSNPFGPEPLPTKPFIPLCSRTHEWQS
uniref:Uncharacterized protein n=1 Tax=Nothobranchius korthausae TaxID=1143690 RepID=A0A1A8EUR3_9TELE